MRRRTTAAGLVALIALVVSGLGLPRPSVATGLRGSAASDAALAGAGIGHVFLIVLENESYAASYRHNPHHYLGRTLQKQGTLLTRYYAIGHASLGNYLAMISGQAPDRSTSADCPFYSTFRPTTHPVTIDRHGQAVGQGCVYPTAVQTLPDQLAAHGVSWAGYMDQMGRTRSREQRRCGVPHLTSAHKDDTQSATKHDQYAARHNPFVYFNSLLSSGQCAKHVVRLGRLRHDLQRRSTTPAFSFISPDLCNDGHDSPCRGVDSAGSRKGGLASVDHFLHTYVPLIKASPAYHHDGLIIITTDESNGSAARCCHERPGPNEHKPGVHGPGGGRVGSLVIGACVRRGAKDATRYNHYSLLRSLEDIYGITTGGSDAAGHLGFAGARGLRPFGTDVVRRCASRAASPG